MLKKEKLLVLGANGFLGKNVSELLSKDDRYDLLFLNGKEDLDLTKQDNLEKYLASNTVDYVINCAAFVGGIAYGYDYPADLLTKNSTMALNIYNSCYKNNIKFLINPISNCAYPENQELYEEKNFWNGKPHDSVFEYGFSKKLFTALGQAFYKEYKFNSANIVLSNMYGPHDHFDEKKSHALGALIKKIYIAKIENLDTVQIWGTGKPIREWLYVEDGAKALVKSLDLEPNYYFFNVGVNKGISILDMALIISNYLNWKGKFEFDLTKPDGAFEKRVLGRLTEKYLNWLPETTLEAGIKTTIDWYIENSHS